MAHLELCGSCKTQFRSLQGMRELLRTMDRPALPAGLAGKLLVMASHERQRVLERVSFKMRLRTWWGRTELCFDNLWRPMALPFAGGMLSALIVFGSIMQSQAFPYNVRNDDTPPNIATDPDGEVVDWDYARLQQMPQLLPVTQDVSGDATAILLLIDPKGRIADYMVADGEATREMKNFFLFSRFTPATAFGQPTWGYKLVLFPKTPAAVRG
jgi:hypothetical protein